MDNLGLFKSISKMLYVNKCIQTYLAIIRDIYFNLNIFHNGMECVSVHVCICVSTGTD